MPALKAVIGADAAPMLREFQRIERMSAQAGVNIQRNIGGGAVHSGTGGIIRETIVVLRELLSGRFNARTAGSISILSQRLGVLKYFVKDNALAAQTLAGSLATQAQKSLLAADAARAVVTANKEAMATMRIVTAGELMAAKADEERAVAAIASANADRAKAASALQAASAMESEGVAARFSIGPLGWVAVALITLGAAAYFAVRHFSALREEVKNLRDLMDTSHTKFSLQAEAMKEGAVEARAFNDWLKKLGESQVSLGEKTEIALKAMREQAKFEKELAESKGATKKQLAQMDIDEAKKELEYLNAMAEQAGKNVEAHKADARDAEKAANDHDRKSKIKNLGEKSVEAGKIADAIEEKMKEGVNDFKVGNIGGQSVPATTHREATANDQMKVTVDGKEFSMSLNQAKASFDKLTAEEDRLADVQKELNDLAQDKKELTKQDVEDLKRLKKERDELQADLELKSKYLPQIVDSQKGQMSHGHVNSLQSVGAYTPGAVSVFHSMDKKLGQIAKNTAHTSKGGHGSVGDMTRTDFGDH